MGIVISFIIGAVAGIVAGALIWRKNGARVENVIDAAKGK